MKTLAEKLLEEHDHYVNIGKAILRLEALEAEKEDFRNSFSLMKKATPAKHKAKRQIDVINEMIDSIYLEYPELVDIMKRRRQIARMVGMAERGGHYGHLASILSDATKNGHAQKCELSFAKAQERFPGATVIMCENYAYIIRDGKLGHAIYELMKRADKKKKAEQEVADTLVAAALPSVDPPVKFRLLPE